MLGDRRFAGGKAVWAALRPLGPDLRDAEQVVHEPYEFFGDRVRFAPPDPLEVLTLAVRAAAHPGRVAVGSRTDSR
ncbi:hypothetical protein AB0L42_42005 [Streptomyces sp. NPDC052287]|uniref:hypothetical protein n=1 Tax=Streptomyces sp. NPDC052287 TaxID=3154950 RepID=UPI00341D0328